MPDRNPPFDEDDDELFEQFDGPHSPWPRQAHGRVICPKCSSPKVEALHTARRIGGTVGTTAGAAGAFAAAMAGVESGATVGAIVAGPPGAAFGALMGAILAAIAGGTIGGAAGIALGDQIDSRIWKNCVCHDCGHEFSLDTRKIERADWLEVHKTGIGVSDAAAAVGLSPYKSQLEL